MENHHHIESHHSCCPHDKGSSYNVALLVVQFVVLCYAFALMLHQFSSSAEKPKASSPCVSQLVAGWLQDSESPG
jgi:hypothetical protein